MKNKILVVFLCLIVCITSASAVFATDIVDNNDGKNESVTKELNCEIKSVELLEDEIANKSKDGSITSEEADEIINNTDAETLACYMGEVDDKAMELLEESTPETIYFCDEDVEITKYNVKVDELSTVELTITDRPELSVTDKIANEIKSVFVLPVYAASNGEEIWKPYGNRYFTAKYTRYIGTGYITMCTENHYNVSSLGIKERYATSWVHSMVSITGDLSSTGYSIEDEWAKTPGASDAHIKSRVTMKYQTTFAGVTTTSYSTYYERTKINYLEKDAANSRIKIRHSWCKL